MRLREPGRPAALDGRTRHPGCPSDHAQPSRAACACRERLAGGLRPGVRKRAAARTGRALCAAARVCLGQRTDLPIVLQHAGHSRTIIGTTAIPSGLLLRDPAHAERRCAWLSKQELDGRQYQLVLVRNRSGERAASARLSAQQAHSRAGDPEPAAVWHTTGWQYCTRTGVACASRPVSPPLGSAVGRSVDRTFGRSSGVYCGVLTNASWVAIGWQPGGAGRPPCGWTRPRSLRLRTGVCR